MKERFHRPIEDTTKSHRNTPYPSTYRSCYVKPKWQLPKRWNRSGTVVKNHGHQKNTIEFDGSGRLTRETTYIFVSWYPASHLIQPVTSPATTTTISPSVPTLVATIYVCSNSRCLHFHPFKSCVFANAVTDSPGIVLLVVQKLMNQRRLGYGFSSYVE